MSRYIDADDAANAIYHHFPSIRTMADARGIIEEAPSIDIVRCKECKWCLVEEGGCERIGMVLFADEIENHFCGYAERKESE